MEKKKLLANYLSKSVSELVGNRKEVPISFSGGVDSFITAALTKKYSVPILYTIGNENSKDLIYSKIAAESLGCQLEVINLSDNDIVNGIEKTIEIIGKRNSLDVLIGSTFYLIAKRIQENNFNVCLSGQGADELFFGYDKYRRALVKGEDPIQLRNKDVAELKEILVRREYKIFESFGIKFLSPFLDKEVKKIGMDLEIEVNLRDKNDDLRKHVLREIAADLGAPPEIVNRKKKALQYGSGILEDIRRISKKKGLASSLNAYLESI
ncbi:MAG: asparagine synthetase B [Candidatus Methanofastidiosum methylothiophilum]|uniref:Asparagine synthetase B n=1 Tax=Candidatus Methanofastidiosum methylothiophilum TaxID=1705564 RepID=A0A150J146_9EURY|nr:MAG: asparagine synthetase B [Candidatus Methanofastidiosum methylthiophilus]KYC48304.1 MAG: asparagine synthetase B [Candidatus Methanofastidiosum methylthiophilus]KYC50973.1 MAG: asparagine synthetase B [Candidatus Methanofastidiosum methylthiophilus]